jgi:hypothetical protein
MCVNKLAGRNVWLYVINTDSDYSSSRAPHVYQECEYTSLFVCGMPTFPSVHVKAADFNAAFNSQTVAGVRKSRLSCSDIRAAIGAPLPQLADPANPIICLEDWNVSQEIFITV